MGIKVDCSAAYKQNQRNNTPGKVSKQEAHNSWQQNQIPVERDCLGDETAEE